MKVPSWLALSVVPFALPLGAQNLSQPQGLGLVGQKGGEPVIRALILQGDVVAGIGTVTTISNFAVNNSGTWLVEAATDAPSAANDVLFQNGVLFLNEGQSLPAPVGATINTFDTVNLNNAGDSAWNLFLEGTTGTSDDSGLYFGTNLLIQESDSSTAAGFSAGTVYRGFFEAKLNDSDEILYIATVDDPGIAGTLEQALLIATVDGSGNLVSETVLAVEGDLLPGQTEVLGTFATNPHAFSLNATGDVMFTADLVGSTSNDVAVYRNSTLIAQETGPSPVPLRNWLLSTATTAVNQNDKGSYVLKGALNGLTNSNTLISKDGTKFVQEGDALPAIAPFVLTSLGTGPVWIGNDGSVLWYGEWNDPNTDVNSALFLNDEILVQEGVTELEGQLVDTLRGVTDGFTMSDSGVYILFEAILQDGTDGAFLVERQLIPRGLTIPKKAAGADWNLDAGPGFAGRPYALFAGERGDTSRLLGAGLEIPKASWHIEFRGFLDRNGGASVSAVPSFTSVERFFVVLDGAHRLAYVSNHILD